jgi:hypothetical protein
MLKEKTFIIKGIYPSKGFFFNFESTFPFNILRIFLFDLVHENTLRWVSYPLLFRFIPWCHLVGRRNVLQCQKLFMATSILKRLATSSVGSV